MMRVGLLERAMLFTCFLFVVMLHSLFPVIAADAAESGVKYTYEKTNSLKPTTDQSGHNNSDSPGWDWLVQWVDDLIASLSSIGQLMVDTVTQYAAHLWDSMPDWAKGLLFGLLTALIVVAAVALLLAAGVITAAVAIAAAIGALIAGALYGILTGGEHFNFFDALFASALGAVLTALALTSGLLASLLNGARLLIWEPLGALFTQVRLGASLFGRGLLQAGQLFGRALAGAGQLFSRGFMQAAQLLGRGFLQAGRLLGRELLGACSALARGIASRSWQLFGRSLSGSIQTIGRGLMGAGQTLGRALLGSWQAFSRGLVGALQMAGRGLVSAFSTVGRSFGSLAGSVWAGLRTAGTTFWSGLTQLWGAYRVALPAMMKAAKEGFIITLLFEFAKGIILDGADFNIVSAIKSAIFSALTGFVLGRYMEGIKELFVNRSWLKLAGWSVVISTGSGIENCLSDLSKGTDISFRDFEISFFTMEIMMMSGLFVIQSEYISKAIEDLIVKRIVGDTLNWGDPSKDKDNWLKNTWTQYKIKWSNFWTSLQMNFSPEAIKDYFIRITNR